MPSSARLVPLLVALLVAVLALAACGDGGGGDAAETTGGGAFPVTIDGALGSATIESAPTRVVALGQTDPDAALALGVTPVGIRAAFIGGLEPWIADAVRTAEPEVIGIASGIPFERVAALRPDLILAGDVFGLDQTAYDRLAAIAPTVSFRTESYGDSWQDNTLTIGRALGRAAEAERLVDDVEARIAADGEAHPEFAGKTFSFSNHYAPGAIVTLQSGDVVDLFEALGLELAPGVADLPASPSAPGNADLSLERLATLDADVVLMVYSGDQGLRTQLEANPLYDRLAAVERGDDVFVPLDVATALRSPSALGLPWALDRLVPELETALGS